jgi:hypothetical protein
MRCTTKVWTKALMISLVVGALVPSMGSFADDREDPRVLPPNAVLFGKTLGEWSAAWWQYVFSIPASDNPLFDETGAKCGVEQSGPVFFLVGVINVSGTARRICTVPAGKALFFPILNVEDNNAEHPDAPVPLTIAQLLKSVDGFVQLATALHVSIDGERVPNLFAHRAISPTFEITLPAVTPPEQNLEQALGFNVSGTIQPVVSDGFWIMIPSLSRGRHTINFGGTFGPPINFTLDITYRLTVSAE